MSLTKIISENITYYREKLGITQKEAAIQAGISPNYWNWIENGTRIPTLETLYKVTHVLNISIAELFSGIETIIPEIKTYIFDVDPNTKPRMTRRDKWAKRKCVTDYWTWADGARAAWGKVEKVVLTQPTTLSIVAYFSIPESWSRHKKEQAKNMPHTVKPDGDNVMKALKDALFHNDQMVVDGWYRKLWDDGKGSRVEVTIDA